MNRQSPLRPLHAATIGAGLVFLSLGATATQAQPPIVQPGAPGQPSRVITAAVASDLAGIRFTEGDVRFMQGMISHHAQALEMTELLDTRTGSDAMRQMARRIELSQEDEIAMMQDWLRARDQTVTEIDAHHAPGWQPMPGMLTAEEMESLAEPEGAAFDRLFLDLMIKHHRGALTMVENLLDQRGAAQDSQLFAFTTDITSDQTMEIDRMDAMLAGLTPDPRVQLAAGFEDAGQALWNMALVASRPKPDGFYDPHAPAGRPMPAGPPAEAEPVEAAPAEGEESGDGAEHDQSMTTTPSTTTTPSMTTTPSTTTTPSMTTTPSTPVTMRSRKAPSRNRKRPKRTKRTTRSGADCSTSGTPTSPSPATGCSSAATTASTLTASRSPRRPNWSPRWCAPADRETCRSSAIC
jgi:uncharacterized protein (DUF305 family)